MKIFRKWMSLGLVALFLALSSFQLHAQVPLNPKVRMGKLENGLTYYIQKNDQTEKRADFYIAQKVGAILETPEQSGLAHFLEHMCFNGTTHFPGDQLKQYLETIGVKFGENLNAYTSIDETVYNISNVPVIRDGVIDSCLLILHDWSNDLILDPKEIDKERGVITEEWRSGQNAGRRYFDVLLKKAMAGTQYENCNVIGNMEVIKNFKYQTLRDYYEKWYRPDQQAIIVVGDINVDQIEQKIKTLFADVPAQPDAAERVYYPANDNDEPIVVTYQDKEQTNVMLTLYSKYDAIPKEAKASIDYLVISYATSMIENMINARLAEIAEQPNPPFIAAGIYDSDFITAKTKKSFTSAVICKEEDIQGGIKVLLNEVERVRQHGFTASEYARAKATYLTALESAFNERDKAKNVSYVNEYVRHFLDNEPAPGIEFEYPTMNQMANQIPVEVINQILPMLLQDKNKVLSLFAPKKDGLVIPTDSELIDLIKNAQASKLEPYEDKVSDEPLLSKEPKGGKIVKEQKNTLHGTHTLILSNGVKVVIKPTDFKADQIIMNGFSYGGNSVFDNAEHLNFSAINDYALVGGLGNFSTIDLTKALAGKNASVSTSVNYLTESIKGSSTPKDFETMLQLAYLSFTAPRKDVDAFNSNISRAKAVLANQELNPQSAYGDSINVALYKDNVRAKRMHAKDLDQLNYDRILEMYMDRFKDASDFTFVLVGNVDIEAMKPLIAKYLGGLPAIKRKENYIDRNLDVRKGLYKNEFIRKQDQPKASIFVYYNNDVKYNVKNDLYMTVLSDVMTLVYTEKVREDEGGTYGVYVNGSISAIPKENGEFMIVFDTEPAKKDKLMEIVYRELDNVINNGPAEADLAKVKENLLKKHNELLKENKYWSSVIQTQLLRGLDFHTDHVKEINAITGSNIKDFAKKFFEANNKAEVMMISPEE